MFKWSLFLRLPQFYMDVTDTMLLVRVRWLNWGRRRWWERIRVTGPKKGKLNEYVRLLAGKTQIYVGYLETPNQINPVDYLQKWKRIPSFNKRGTFKSFQKSWAPENEPSTYYY